MPAHTYRRFESRTPPELGGPGRTSARVAIVGAGPVGLAMALELAHRGVATVVLDDNDVVSVGSRAICWSKRTLEIFDRLGVGAAMVEEGVTWQTGRVFAGDREIYAFDLLPEPGHKMPAFVNLQQYRVEELLVERCGDFPELIDLRWSNKVVGHRDCGPSMSLEIEAREGRYTIEVDYLLACDGARSPTRERMGLALQGETFDEAFLIADVEMADDPFGRGGAAERWFWFAPPFHDGQSALLHKQPGNIYRIDLQLGADADATLERHPERVMPRLRAIVGDRPFRLDWLSVYRFTCARLETFVHGRVVFVGDAAHIVSPFGARGGNGGIQDVDGLGWKLGLVLDGAADPSLLATYDEERGFAADENIAASARSTAFMTPKSPGGRTLRDAVLDLAGPAEFARRLVNSGRLSAPACYGGLSLQSEGAAAGRISPGVVCPDAPIEAGGGAGGWLLDALGKGFALLTIGEGGRGLTRGAPQGVIRVHVALPSEPAAKGDLRAGPEVEARYGRDVGYLVRPDQHVAASFGAHDPGALQAAWLRASRTPVFEPAQ